MARPLDGPVWDEVAAHLEGTTAEIAVERAQLLGMAAAVAAAPVDAPRPVRVSPGRHAPRSETPLVVDFSALWAGPLCARLLGEVGARVVKAELAGRPDGARAGPPAFWERLNGRKEQRTLEPAEVRRLLDRADAVVTAARPRAIAQLDLGLERRVREDGLVWIAISGYGSVSPWRERVAFGDDAAVAGGLAVAAGGPDAPVFVGDAPADPLAGLHGAAAARTLFEAGRGGVVDVSMRDGIAAAVVGDRYPATVEEVA